MYNQEDECRILVNSLKRVCRERGITPHALAVKAGLSTSTISYLMNGKTSPQFYTLLSLCNVLDITINDLLKKDSERICPEDTGIENSRMKKEEEALLGCYRKLSDRKKKLLHAYADMLMKYDVEV